MKKSKQGFTLVELIVVIAVLAVLALVMLPVYFDYITKARDSNYMSAAKSWCSALQIAIADNKISPGSWEDIDDLDGILTSLPAIQGVAGTLVDTVEYDSRRSVVIVSGQNCIVSQTN